MVFDLCKFYCMIFNSFFFKAFFCQVAVYVRFQLIFPFVIKRAQPSNSASSNSYNINYSNNDNNKKGLSITSEHKQQRSERQVPLTRRESNFRRWTLIPPTVSRGDTRADIRCRLCVYVFILGCSSDSAREEMKCAPPATETAKQQNQICFDSGPF